MPPTLSWSDLAGTRVGVWGLGVEGTANRRALEARGIEPVLVDDDATVAASAGPGALAFADGGAEALARCEVVVKAPGISRYRPEVTRLEAAGVAVAGGMGLWLAGAPRHRVACITGTKGKSTTTAVAGHLLRGLGRRTVVGGNLGSAPWDPGVDAEAEFFIIETSSFQATDVTDAPGVAAVTSLYPDHLDWHGDAATYFRDKLSLTSHAGAGCTVADGSSPLLRAHADLLGGRVTWIDDTADPAPWEVALGLPGGHGLRNARLARAVLAALGVAEAADPDALAEAARDFPALPSRLEEVGTVDGVTFVDDSLSTNVLPTLAALDTYAPRRVALLVGGRDRGVDYAPLAEAVVARAQPTLVVGLPDNGARIVAALRAAGPGPSVGIVEAPGLAEGVADAFGWARPDGVVLLSPAAPSFGRYRDYRERSAAFVAAMTALGAPPGTP
jgi:UDP-N-acetylmuramoylalanine--D-glutamate ligase